MGWNFYTASGVEKSGTYLGTGIPVGTIASYGGTATPSFGWLLCDGSAVSRTTYSDLFAVIGTFYGAGNGTTTFNLPDSTGDIISYQSFADSVNAVSGTATDAADSSYAFFVG